MNTRQVNARQAPDDYAELAYEVRHRTQQPPTRRTVVLADRQAATGRQRWARSARYDSGRSGFLRRRRQRFEAATLTTS